MNIEIRNIVKLDSGDFDCEINHPIFGWIPFTASKDDPEAFGRDIWESLNKG